MFRWFQYQVCLSEDLDSGTSSNTCSLACYFKICGINCLEFPTRPQDHNLHSTENISPPNVPLSPFHAHETSALRNDYCPRLFSLIKVSIDLVGPHSIFHIGRENIKEVLDGAGSCLQGCKCSTLFNPQIGRFVFGFLKPLALSEQHIIQ